MKLLFISLLCLAGTSLFSEKAGPDYRITKSAAAKGLSKNEAVFDFTFYESANKIIGAEIMFSCDKVNKKQKPNAHGKLNVKVKPGKHIFQFFYNTAYIEVYTDSIDIKPGYQTEISVFFKKTSEVMTVDKPVIYVYTKQKEQVSVKLDLKGDFNFTYPQYTNGWDFTGNPDGSIEMAGKKYHYLFWDGQLNIETEKLDLNEGFVVNKNNLVTFFEEKLTLMGLNSQEIEDYITYWCPRMSGNEKNYIRFMFNDEYNTYASLNVTPKPDHLFRVCMLWSKVTTKNTASLKPQKIESFKRDGFTLVEWGGAEMQSDLFNTKL